MQYVPPYIFTSHVVLLASEESERDTIRGVQIRAGAVRINIYIYVWRYVCHISSACHVYVMWAEFGHRHFLYVPAVSNIVPMEMARALKMF